MAAGIGGAAAGGLAWATRSGFCVGRIAASPPWRSGWRWLSDHGDQIAPRKVKRGDTVDEMRAKTRSGPPAAPEKSSKTTRDAAAATDPASDRVGLLLPSDTAPAFASLSVFEAAQKLHGQLAVLVDQLAQGAGGAGYRQHLVRKVNDDKASFYSPELAS
jgi:hypothetical protein